MARINVTKGKLVTLPTELKLEIEKTTKLKKDLKISMIVNIVLLVALILTNLLR